MLSLGEEPLRVEPLNLLAMITAIQVLASCSAEETEDQQGSLVCLHSHSEGVVEPALKSTPVHRVVGVTRGLCTQDASGDPDPGWDHVVLGSTDTCTLHPQGVDTGSFLYQPSRSGLANLTSALHWREKKC